MKSNYYIRRVNSPFDDSGIFVRNVYMKKAVLFDCGRLGNIDNSELNDISYIFISHTHVDHFSGFDRFLIMILQWLFVLLHEKHRCCSNWALGRFLHRVLSGRWPLRCQP